MSAKITPLCTVKNISFSYSTKIQIFDSINFSLKAGEIVGVLGRNGSGKSTLLNILTGFLHNYKGDIFFDDKNAKTFKQIDYAKNIAYIEQKKDGIPDYYIVKDFVLEGRRPFRKFGFYSEADYALLDKVIRECNLAFLSENQVHNLSGGELQRCYFARALMKEAKLFFADEPCSAMDIKYQKEFFELVHQIKANMNCGILISLHDINLAVQNCDRLLVLRDGSILYDGTAHDISAMVLANAFDVAVSTADGGKRYFYY